jgi:hypothetical protein
MITPFEIWPLKKKIMWKKIYFYFFTLEKKKANLDLLRDQGTRNLPILD